MKRLRVSRVANAENSSVNADLRSLPHVPGMLSILLDKR